MEQLERFNEDYMPSLTNDSASAFEINDAKTADWAIQAIADERKRTKFFIDCAKAEIEKLQNQIKDAEQKCDNSTSFLIGCLGKFLEQDDVPSKKTKTQISLKLPAGKIIKKLPKVEYTMADGKKVTESKSDEGFLKEIGELNPDFIKTKAEVNWSELKKCITADEDGNVLLKETGEYVESLSTKMTLPEIEVKTE